MSRPKPDNLPVNQSYESALHDYHDLEVHMGEVAALLAAVAEALNEPNESLHDKAAVIQLEQTDWPDLKTLQDLIVTAANRFDDLQSHWAALSERERKDLDPPPHRDKWGALKPLV